MSNPQQDIQDWIRTTVAGNDVVLFMKGNKNMPQCGFSAEVDHILRGLGVEFKDVNVLQDLAIREGIKATRTGRRCRSSTSRASSSAAATSSARCWSRRADGDVRRKGRRLRQDQAAGLGRQHHALRASRVVQRRRLTAPALDLPLRMLAGPLRDDRLRRHRAVLGGKIFPRGTSLRKASLADHHDQRRR